MRQGWRAAILACAVAAACSNATTEPLDRRELGIIDIYRDRSSADLVLQLPETIRAGESFQATVTTFGSSSCTHPDGAAVHQAMLSAEITPYDVQASAGTVCTDDLHPFPRAVTLRFTSPGPAVVRVRGRSLFHDEEVVVEQLVTVR